MGLCLDLDDDHGIEIRRESIVLTEGAVTPERQTIFGYEHSVEVEKIALLKLLKFFDNQKNRQRAFGPLLAQYDGLIPNAENIT